MKKLLLIVFILILNISFAQSKQFVYDYISIPDSTQKANNHSEIMVLNITKERSEYFSLKQFISDSTVSAKIKDGSYFLKPPAPPQKKSEMPSRERVNKFLNSNQIQFFTQVAESNYVVHQPIDLKWKLYPEYITVLNYKAQKATTEFGGRKWTAWFAKDIPFQDGPYKFKGLPGLIVKIEDTSNNHQFTLIGVKNTNYNFNYPQNFDKAIDLTFKKYVKAYKTYRKYPATDFKKRYPNIEDVEMINEMEKRLLEQIKKDNNIIEIDLIK